MNSMSFLFFGIMLIPLIIFLVYLIKQDKKKSYIGLVLLVAAALIAIYVIVRYDAKYTKPAEVSVNHR